MCCSHQILTHTLKESEGLITHFKHMQVDVGRETAAAAAANDANQIASKVFAARLLTAHLSSALNVSVLTSVTYLSL